MQWQDLVLTSGQIVFTMALLPTVLGKDKPAFSTSLINGIFLTIFTFTFMSLSLWLTAAGAAGTGIMWFILAYQKYHIDRKAGK